MLTNPVDVLTIALILARGHLPEGAARIVATDYLRGRPIPLSPTDALAEVDRAVAAYHADRVPRP